MKRYLLFEGPDYYPGGGWSDFTGDFDSAEDAFRAAAENLQDWHQVIDLETGDTLAPIEGFDALVAAAKAKAEARRLRSERERKRRDEEARAAMTERNARAERLMRQGILAVAGDDETADMIIRRVQTPRRAPPAAE